MPQRNLATIRRGINRLSKLVEKEKEKYLALKAIAALVNEAKNKVNTTWQNLQATLVTGDKEREERDSSIGILVKWIQQWRPAVLILVPGAASNLKSLPSSAPTPDTIINLAKDMLEFINTNESTTSFREDVIVDLGNKIEIAEKETDEATNALPLENHSREAFSDACLAANPVLVKGTEMVRAIYGPTSPEYKQFISRSKKDDDDDDDENSPESPESNQ